MPLYIIHHFVLLHSEVFTQLHPESIFLLRFPHMTHLVAGRIAFLDAFQHKSKDTSKQVLEQDTRPQTCRLQVKVVSLTDFQPLSRNKFMKNLPFHQVHRSYHPIFSPPKKW